MKKTTLILALSAILPGMAVAGAPTTLGAGTGATYDPGTGEATAVTGGDWVLNADGVTIDHVCPAGMTCSGAPIADNNFLQVQMTDAAGNTYFRTIIATEEAGVVAGDLDKFASDSFVTSGSTNGGIAALQNLGSTQSNSGVIGSSTTLNIGGFNDGTEDQVVLTQDLWDPSVNPQFHAGFGFNKNSAGDQTTTTLSQQIVVTDEFSDSFSYSQVNNLAGNPAGAGVQSTTLDIVSGVVLNDLPGGNVNDQTFRYSLREGAATTGAGSADFGAAGAVTWLADEKVERVLVGQSVVNAGDFGYERVGDLGATPGEITEFSLASVGPFSTISAGAGEVDPFGALADPTGTTIPAIVAP